MRRGSGTRPGSNSSSSNSGMSGLKIGPRIVPTTVHRCCCRRPPVSAVVVVALCLFCTCVTWAAADDSFLYTTPSEDQRLRGFQDDIDGEDVVVDTIQGKLRGKRRHGVPLAGGETDTVDWFLGIPYAKPPLGPLRFKETVSPDEWHGTRNAFRFGSVCPQEQRGWNFAALHLQDEDCLYLNVYSPVPARNSSEDSQSQYPVMVYIHGGSYRVGSGNIFFGHILAQYGVVVVTINYRLGVLGFLSARRSGLEGNYGLYDQIQSLHWIQKSIRAFRGDPSRVTIFGNSAGGASVGILCVSPLTKGLFHNAIIQSGSPLSFWAMHNRSADLLSYVHTLADHLSCDREHISDLVFCLRNVTWQRLAVSSLSRMPKITPSGTDFSPVPDGKLIPDMPRKLFAAGQFNGQSLMTGLVDEEMTRHMGLLFLQDLFHKNDAASVDGEFDDGFDRKTFVKAIEHVMCVKFGYDETIFQIVLHKYTNWSHDLTDPYENRRQYVHFLTDMAMLAPTSELASYVSQAGHPTYFYTMKLDPDNGDYSHWKTNHHQMELLYIFGSPFTGVDIEEGETTESYTDEDRRISRLVMMLWSNFAKTGNPSSLDWRTSPSVKWTVFQKDSGDYLRILSANATMFQYQRPDAISFWNELIVRINERFEGVFQDVDRTHHVWNLVNLILNVVQTTVLLLLLLIIALFVVQGKVCASARR